MSEGFRHRLGSSEGSRYEMCIKMSTLRENEGKHADMQTFQILKPGRFNVQRFEQMER